MKKLLLLFILIVNNLIAFSQHIKFLVQGHQCSIRGLSVFNNKTAWVSGNHGQVGITIDGGLNWQWETISGFEQSDFRDIEAFSKKEAIVMSSGTPAVILKTQDGGKHWTTVYQTNNPEFFLDAMDFSSHKHGFILGDPLDEKFLILETLDAGSTWHTFSSLPKAIPGEAAFAASGTCLRTNPNQVTIVTGGAISRVITFDFSSSTWTATTLPIKQGKNSQGTFSISDDVTVYVGGDYIKNMLPDSTACIKQKSVSGNQLLALSAIPPSGFQSCVEKVRFDVYTSTGTPGSYISNDKGNKWQMIDASSYNVCRKAKHGNLILFAGDKGRIGKLVY